MAVFDILRFPDERLRKKALPVEVVDASVRQIVEDMFETMYEASGIGLAATQVNIQKQIIVVDLSEEQDSPVCLINPEILEDEGLEQSEEGCLSVPGFFETVERAEKIKVRAIDEHGKVVEITTDGMLAVCIQHEIDHLEGKLFVDYLSAMKRQRIRKKLEKGTRGTPRKNPRRSTES